MRNMRTQNSNTSNLTPQSYHKRTFSSSCPNHLDKPVTHALIGPNIHEQISYCEKCSIMLASQGFNVVKLNLISSLRPSPVYDPRNQRQLEIQSFIVDLNHQIETIRDQGMAVDEQLRTSEQNYGKVMDDLTVYFQQIETIVQIQKYLTYNSVLSQRSTAQAQLRDIREALSGQLEGLVGIAGDIENNMEAVESVENQIYQTIMQNYRAKLHISYQIEDFDILEVTSPSAAFAEIPKELYSLVDKIQLKINNQPQFTPKVQSSIKSNRSSRLGHRTDHHQGTLSDTLDPKQSHEEKYSFDQSEEFQRQLNQLKFRQKKGNNCYQRHKLLPNEMLLRQSLNLTEIRQNQEQPQGLFRRFSNLEETIPEEMRSSQESIDGYLAIDSLRSKKVEEKVEETDTLLIC